MDQLFRHLGHTEQTWGPNLFTEREEVDVCEVSKETNQSVPKACCRTIPRNDLTSWSSRTLACRIVCIIRDTIELRNDISVTSLDHILDIFGLKSAYEHYSTAFAGAASLPPQRTSQHNVRSYCFCYHPKIILLWSRDSARGCTQGVFFAGNAQVSALRDLLTIDWPFMDHDMMPAFLCSVLMSSEINTVQNVIKQEVRQTEVRTGFHRWSGRREPRKSGDLSALSAMMSGCASKSASGSRKIQVIQDLNQFVMQKIEDLEDQSLTGSSEALKQHVMFMQSRAKMQQVDVEFFVQRANVQLSALVNLIAQNDAIHSHEFARDTKIIASASQRDSFSMKILAVLTMCFLPGTFVATLFSMTIFNWDAASASNNADPESAPQQQQRIISTRFWVYWATAIPLTLLTFLICAVWMLWERARQTRQMREAESKLEAGLVEPEVKALIIRRSATGTSLGASADT